MRYNKLKSLSQTNPFSLESSADYYKLYSPNEDDVDLEQDNEDLDSDLLLGSRSGRVRDHNLKNSHVQDLPQKRMLNL